MKNWISKNKTLLFGGTGATIIGIALSIILVKDEPQTTIENTVINSIEMDSISLHNIPTDELVDILSYRAERINKKLRKYYKYAEVDVFLSEFNELHTLHIEAIKNNDFIFAHDILSSIHIISFKLQLSEEFAEVNDNEPIDIIYKSTESFTTPKERPCIVLKYITNDFRDCSNKYPDEVGYQKNNLKNNYTATDTVKLLECYKIILETGI